MNIFKNTSNSLPNELYELAENCKSEEQFDKFVDVFYKNFERSVNNINKKKNRYTLLSIACQNNTEYGVKLAKLLLENGANPNIYAEYGCFPIFLVIIENKTKYTPEMLKLLLDNGANPHKIHDGYSNTGEDRILCDVLRRNKTQYVAEIVSILIDHGININLSKRNGFSALHYLFEYQNEYLEDIINVILDKEIKLDTYSNVFELIRKKNKKIAKLESQKYSLI